MQTEARLLPPGPKRRFPGDFLLQLRRGPLRRFEAIAAEFGEIAYFTAGTESVCFINDPDLIREVLVTQHKNFLKGRGLERAKKLLGEGLLTSEAPLHLRQRRLMQPAFHSDRIRDYGRVMVGHGERMGAGWHDGATLDVAQQMMHLTLGIVGQTLFGADVNAEAKEIGVALTDAMESFFLLMLPFADFLEKIPLPKIRRGQAARAKLDAIIYSMIDERRASGEDRGDLLSMLLALEDTEGDGTGMSNQQVRDEAMTIFLAGHETTANALTWTWYLLSQHPEVEARLHAELEGVLAGGAPSLAHLRQLVYTEKVVTEAMRLYPPAWMIGRRAIHAFELNGYTIPARTIVVMSQWVMHRNAKYFDAPETFDPERWTPEFKAALPKYAYFPFGGGPRQCIGEGFAWMELILLIATLARHWKMARAPGHPVAPQPLVTLRPKHGMPMTLRRR